MNQRFLNENIRVKIDFFTDKIPSRQWQNYEELLVVKVVSSEDIDWREVKYINALLRVADTVFAAKAIIVDFSECCYSFGDGLSELFNYEECLIVPENDQMVSKSERKIVVAITSASNRNAFESLFKDVVCKDPKRFLSVSISEAIDLIEASL